MISFVYFDVGGVVIQDFSGTNKWQALMRDLHIPETKMNAFSQLMKVYRLQSSIGYMTLDEEIAGAKKELDLIIPDTYSFLDDFVNRFEQNQSLWPVIATIHKTYRIGLLTNMFIGMLDRIREKGLFPNESWDVVIDSSIVHVKKPEKEMYELAKEKAHVPHEEIFLIDNLEENIVAAKQFGWQTFLYDSKNPEDSSKKLLELFTAK